MLPEMCVWSGRGSTDFFWPFDAQSSTTTAHEVLQSRRCPLGSLISKSSESESEGRVARMVMSPVILATPPSSMLKPISRSAASARCRSNFKTRMDHSPLLACCEPNAPSSQWLAEHRNEGRRRADLNLGQPRRPAPLILRRCEPRVGLPGAVEAALLAKGYRRWADRSAHRE
jgi:hypothetical protein